MRELNEQELEQVAGGSGWTFSYLSQKHFTFKERKESHEI